LAAVLLAGAVLLAVQLAGESSRAMPASARLSCYTLEAPLQSLQDMVIGPCQRSDFTNVEV